MYIAGNKKYIRKKVMSVIIAAALIVGAVYPCAYYASENTIRAYAAEQTGAAACDRDFIYSVDQKGNVHLKAYKGNESEVVVPDTIDGKKVTDLGSGIFKNCTKVILTNTDAALTRGTFRDAESLKALSFGRGRLSLSGTVMFLRIVRRLKSFQLKRAVVYIKQLTAYCTAVTAHPFIVILPLKTDQALHCRRI